MTVIMPFTTDRQTQTHCINKHVDTLKMIFSLSQAQLHHFDSQEEKYEMITSSLL